MIRQVLGVALVAAAAEAFSVAPSAPMTGSRVPAIARAGAHQSSVSLRRPALSSLLMTAAAPSKDAPKIVPDKEHKLYVYDHCPFCVRARLIFGLKNVNYNLVFMANDDIPTPTKLIGKKLAPILEIPADGFAMPESMDIVKRIDEDQAFGPSILKPASDRADIKAWEKKVKPIFGQLQRPRYVATGLLPEFAFASARDAFVKNHQMPGFEKADWKSDAYDMAFRKAEYQKAMEKTPELLVQANEALKEMEDIIYSPQHCSEQGLSYDDIALFARLRSITIIKGIQMGPKLQAYMEYFSKAGDVPLYDAMAL